MFYSVPGKPVISDCGFCTKSMLLFLEHHMQPIAQKVNLLFKKTNQFLRKTKSLSQLSEGAIHCLIDVVGHYHNIPHGEVLASFRRFLDARTEKKLQLKCK